MKHFKSNYPIGATWKSIGIDGIVATVTLLKREENLEVWYSSWNYSDGSCPLSSSDWYPSKNSAVQSVNFKCKDKNNKIIRMKRII